MKGRWWIYTLGCSLGPFFSCFHVFLFIRLPEEREFVSRDDATSATLRLRLTSNLVNLENLGIGL
jgi:hypothetical protein